MSKEVRVRFAPSPTGPLHIGGLRTALYNYLLAKKNGGKFLLRMEDTDQSRYVEGAEDYIVESLNWLGIIPDEGFEQGGNFGPYRQSDRKDIYNKYVKKIIANGHAYYAFDSTTELEAMREKYKAEGIHSPRYDQSTRGSMRNSLTLSDSESDALITAGANVVVRLKVPENQQITFFDEIRGEVSFNSTELDDKVLMKSGGMPTYHLANVVDDYLMKISHVIRGEEWLSSTGHHVLLYRAFEWNDNIPKFAHLPLILKPTGKGKLSKRDGAKFGFPVFPLTWQDKVEDELYSGFREMGFLPEAVINFLAFLGWNPGTEQEIFSLKELEKSFDVTKIIKSGAKFNYDKAKWYNQQYIINTPEEKLVEIIADKIEKKVGRPVESKFLKSFCGLMKERVMTLNDFETEGAYFFSNSFQYDIKTIKKKFKIENALHFTKIIDSFKSLEKWKTTDIQDVTKGYITKNELSFGAILPILRVCLTGTMKGPDVFQTMELLGKGEVISRMTTGLEFCKAEVKG
ncbi:MAG: glutamate--tRNA ligase [Saprospiraceae bacterium]